MGALKDIEHAYFDWRIANKVPDDEAVLIRVTYEYRMRIMADNTGGAFWQESGGRNPKERLFGCPMEAVRPELIEDDYEFVRPGYKPGGFVPDFLVDPSTGGA